MQSLFKVVEINHPNHPLMVSLSNHRRPSFRQAQDERRSEDCEKALPALTRTHFVIATPYLIRGWQSRRRSNDGAPACVQPQRDCHVVRQAHHERLCSSQ